MRAGLLRTKLEPAVYDLLQEVLGAGRSRRQVASVLRGLKHGRVLDVGAGTGVYASAVPASCEYVALDVDEARLRRLLRKHPAATVVSGDATALPFPDASFDVALCIALAHHLPDDALARLVDELARVVTGHVVFLDPLRDDALASRMLWRLDQGAHPRSEDELTAALRVRFELVAIRTYRTIHRYLLCVAAASRAGAGEGAG